jgi:hypothetical protein
MNLAYAMALVLLVLGIIALACALLAYTSDSFIAVLIFGGLGLVLLFFALVRRSS